MDIKVLYALIVLAIGRDAIDMQFSTVFDWFCKGANEMNMSLESFADVVLHDAAQDIKLGQSYGQYDEVIAQYYNIH